MSTQEIIDSEKRGTDDLYEIHFYMEGSFWRAYEWSAYLSRRFPSSLTDDERLRPLKRVLKSSNCEYVQVGLQLNSFEKYFPNVINDDSKFEMIDKHIVIHAESFFLGEDISDYEKVLNEWKSSIKLSVNEKKKQKEANIIVNDSEITIDELIKEIISYPMEKKSLIDNLHFLSNIRDKAIKIAKTVKVDS